MIVCMNSVQNTRLLNTQKLPAASLSHSPRGAAPKLNETPFVITEHGMNKSSIYSVEIATEGKLFRSKIAECLSQSVFTTVNNPA